MRGGLGDLRHVLREVTREAQGLLARLVRGREGQHVRTEVRAVVEQLQNPVEGNLGAQRVRTMAWLGEPTGCNLHALIACVPEVVEAAAKSPSDVSLRLHGRQARGVRTPASIYRAITLNNLGLSHQLRSERSGPFGAGAPGPLHPKGPDGVRAVPWRAPCDSAVTYTGGGCLISNICRQRQRAEADSGVHGPVLNLRALLRSGHDRANQGTHRCPVHRSSFWSVELVHL
jgi:hypothetical protein